ncbi:hypothetical protein [Sporosarcina highlanderae]|uniref:Uncharacterized protein n=1 Tax=Sporosarcina highlanderae TaxID=3035916 RepID=A0ABT8JQL5_9BACL|nr:hypothetical protein [Sporosarcina highlanderae]MDN4607365.1 hypothetical protein [Sporosarcina highlanderae]
MWKMVEKLFNKVVDKFVEVDLKYHDIKYLKNRTQIVNPIIENIPQRNTHCWSCKRSPLSTNTHKCCAKCKWIICDNCGQCSQPCTVNHNPYLSKDRKLIISSNVEEKIIDKLKGIIIVEYLSELLYSDDFSDALVIVMLEHFYSKGDGYSKFTSDVYDLFNDEEEPIGDYFRQLINEIKTDQTKKVINY